MAYNHTSFHLLFSPFTVMATGTIKTKTDKGFGFITVTGSADVFFHNTACNGQYDNMNVGDAVQFDLVKGDKGPKAENVVLAKGQGNAEPQLEDALAA